MKRKLRKSRLPKWRGTLLKNGTLLVSRFFHVLHREKKIKKPPFAGVASWGNFRPILSRR
jgi:hypothetical protein